MTPSDRRFWARKDLSPLPMIGAFALVALWWAWWIGRSALLFDEAYYWDWSRRLDLGYVDHPPLVALLIRLTTALGGANEFTVRLGMVACGLGTVALAARAGLLLGGRLAGWLCLAMAATCPLFGLLFSFAGPDAPMMLCWAATVYAALLAVTSMRGRYWYAAGALLGLALLSKYVAALLVPSLLLFMLLSRRGWLRRREPYLAGVIALLVLSPNLWWNAQHAWVSITFQTTHGACVSSARSVDYVRQALLYIQNQVTLVGPLLAVALVAGTAFSLNKGLRERDDGHLLLACCTLVIGVVFFLLHGVRHWAAPGYFSAIVSAGVLLATLAQRVQSARRALLALGCALLLIAGVVEWGGLQTAYNTRTTTVDGGSGLLMDTAARIDAALLQPEPRWPVAARLVSSVLSSLPPSDRRATLLVADTYGTAAEMAFYLPGHPRVYSDANQYLLWPPPPGTYHTLLFVANTPVTATPNPVTGGIRPEAVLAVLSGKRVVSNFTVTRLYDPRTASGGSTLSDLLTSTAIKRQVCQ